MKRNDSLRKMVLQEVEYQIVDFESVYKQDFTKLL